MTPNDDERSRIRDVLALGLNEAVEAADKIEQNLVVPMESSLFGRFELLKEVGRGGMGVVYQARETVTSRTVALKTIMPGLVSVAEVRQRFEREVRAAAALEHDNILRIYEVGEWGGFPYFSMQFAEHGSLLDQLAVLSRKEPNEIAQLLIKIANGIQHAHDCSIIHRDLKPANILLNAADEPLIADFGLAQLLLDSPLPDLTKSLVILGTPGYIAPELVKGQATKAADVYGLGAIFYHLLSGHRPFEELSGFQVLSKAAEGPPPRLRRFKPEIPKAFEAICHCCLQPEAEARYPSARALALELERVMGGRFRRATPPGRKGKRIHTVLLATGLALFFLGTWFWMSHRPGQPLGGGGLLKPQAKYFVDRALELLAREHNEPNLRVAELLVRQAVTLDPNSAIVHAELSRILSKRYWHIAPEESVAKEAESEAARALQLDGRLPASHLAFGDYHFRCRRDYSAALVSLRKAGELGPRDSTVPALTALILKRLNRWEEALACSRRACELDPESAPRYYDLAVTCDILRRYPDAIAAIERAAYLAPDNPTHTLLHGWLLFRANGDTSGLESIAMTLPFQQQMDPQYFDTVFLWLLWSRHHNEALRLAERLPDDYSVRRYDAFLIKPYFVGLARRAADDKAGSTEAFEATRAILEQRVGAFPQDARIHAQLGIVYGYLGRTAEAVREGQRAVELLPLPQEPVGGSYIAAQLAEVYATVGEKEKALSLIEDLLARPGYLTVHDLKVDPRWNPLRNDPRFQRLVAVGLQD